MDRTKAFVVAHVALVLFSTIALTTILAGAGYWITGESALTVYRWGWKLSAPLYVIFGAIAIFLHARQRFGRKKTIKMFVVCTLIALFFEILGTSTGIPFGDYTYSPVMGYRIADLVPFMIPLSWFYMVYASLAIVSRLFRADHHERTKSAWALMAGALMTAWDIALDPAMSTATGHWTWSTDDGGFFYGMPFTNWVGWFLTGSIVARAMLWVSGITNFDRKVSPSRLPLLIYGVNGLMPIAICLRHQLWWAAILGAIAMGIPLFFAWRAQMDTGALEGRAHL